MMKISLSDTGKRFNRDWIFRGFNYEFNSGNSYAITGPNGSGKSTLLQVIGGAVGASTGLITCTINNTPIEADNLYRYLSIAAPYLELVEEMTAIEFLQFHGRFKQFLPDTSIAGILKRVGLEKSAHKQIRYYSSGMKQRLKLAQSIFSDVPCLLLDEPCTNLDAEGITLYQELIGQYALNRIIIVSSNDIQEYGFCKERIDILNYKGISVS